MAHYNGSLRYNMILIADTDAAIFTLIIKLWVNRPPVDFYKKVYLKN